jgi:ubiquinone/menaquinone biosynthesis C-methylase UbiE
MRQIVRLSLLFFPLSGPAAIVWSQTAPPAEKSSTVAPRGQQSVRPGINDTFLDPQLNVGEWVERFEVESREVYAARHQIVAETEIRPGMRMADVGAGTGLFSRLFAEAVGSTGWVFAVDISPRFLEHIAAESQRVGIDNISPILAHPATVQLPPDSIDVAFLCDTYHHFEYPERTLRSIHRALHDRGALIVVDFERIPGVSREWILSHVRAGKETFTDEIRQAGFALIEQVDIDGFEENYFLRFEKR